TWNHQVHDDSNGHEDFPLDSLNSTGSSSSRRDAPLPDPKIFEDDDEKGEDAPFIDQDPDVESPNHPSSSDDDAERAITWTPWSKRCFILGLGIMIVTIGLEASMVSTYTTYALSSLNRLSSEGTLDVASSVISVVLKLPFAKASDVLGRAETYMFTVGVYTFAYFFQAVAPSFGVFALGAILYTAGAAGTHVLDFILIADVTSMRNRGLAGNLFFVPSLITPWLSGVISDKVVNGIGWRWGFGILILVFPIGATLLVRTLYHIQRQGTGPLRKHITLRDFCSQIDLGGISLLCGGLAFLLVPITLSTKGDSSDHFKTRWVPALVVVGLFLLVCGWFWEQYVAAHPAMPARYFKMGAIIATLSVAVFDAAGYTCTHTYLFPWSVAAKNFSARDALYLKSTSGISHILTGLATGALMHRMRAYKKISIIGSVVRLVGYGLMTRLRTNDSTAFELFLVQVIQGAGSGIIETTMIVATQIVVPHAELAQVTAMIAMAFHLGGGIGSAIAGGIYTSTFKPRLRVRMGSGVEEHVIDSIYDSITGTLPEWGSVERIAVGAAYSDVIGYMTFGGLAACFPVVLILACLMPDNKLGDGKNLVSEKDGPQDLDEIPMQRAKVSGP
ncbi:siderochrome-iron transporter, partial [Lecanosticta acicola]